MQWEVTVKLMDQRLESGRVISYTLPGKRLVAAWSCTWRGVGRPLGGRLFPHAPSVPASLMPLSVLHRLLPAREAAVTAPYAVEMLRMAMSWPGRVFCGALCCTAMSSSGDAPGCHMLPGLNSGGTALCTAAVKAVCQ
jgi:hypothetical protein